MKLSHAKLIALSGAVWFAIGIYLLNLGLNLLVINPSTESAVLDHYPLLKTITPFIGSLEAAALTLVIIALAIGYYKGRYVLGKSAQRGVERIQNMPNPAPLSKIYSGKYYILLGSMVALGISIKYLGLSNDVRGFIDTIIGAALINGAVIYFRKAQLARQVEKS